MTVEEACPAGVCAPGGECGHCCKLGCNGGACETCPCCIAGWCVNGTDGMPDPGRLELWRALRIEHSIITPEPKDGLATDEFELVPQPYDTGVWCTSCDRYETTEPRTVTCEGCGCEAEAHQPAMVVPR